MSQSKNSKEQTVKHNLLASRLLTGVITIIALYFLISFATDQHHPTGKIYNGIITGVCKTEVGARDDKIEVLVKLDDGVMVQVIAANIGDWQIGKRITVEQMSSMRFGIKTYRFIK